MKKSYYFLFIFSLLLLNSCSGDESLNTNDTVVNQNEENDGPNNNDNKTPENEISENRESTPCDFDLSKVTAGQKIEINCTIDLKGELISIPSDVYLKFNGGDIINGELNFSDNGKIDSELLNSQLELSGDVQLYENNFKFIPSRWDITSGNISRAVAFNNHKNLQSAIDLIKLLTPQPNFNRSNFNINSIDAFFESNTNEIGIAVATIPSNFNLNMTNNTLLRVFPVNDPKFTSKVIRLVGVENVSVFGGSIIGDRRERTASGVGNVLFEIKGGQNIIVDGTTMSFGSITGLTINSVGRKGNPINDGTEYFPSKDVTIKNCVFDSNRSNNLSITDGENITVTDCRIYRAGIDIGQSIGAAPKLGIVIEPFLGQQVEGVKIINNILEENANNSILAAFGNNFYISGNTSQKGVGWNGASNVVIENNPSIGGVLAGDDNAFNLSQSTGNVVRGNTIVGVPTGILASNDDILIENNNIINCKVGMQLRNLKDSRILGNTISSNVKGSFGINTQIVVDNVFIEGNNVIELEDGRPFSIEGTNGEDDTQSFMIRNNSFNCSGQGRINFSSGVTLSMNTFNTSGFGITSSKNIVVEKNTVTNIKDNQHAFFINNSLAVSNIKVTNNTLINTSSQVAYGIRLYISGTNANLKNTSTNIVINDNSIITAGIGIRAFDFNGVTITNNKIDIDDDCCNSELVFNGNNADLRGNTTSSGEPLLRPEIEGLNNQL